jgi:N-acetylglucosamine-6-phosphate deacetylase
MTMFQLVLKNALIAENNLADVAVSNGRIAAIEKPGSLTAADSYDCKGKSLFPGFIDIHNHGAAGIDVNEADADGLVEIGRFLLSRGVCGWVPTLVPDSDDVYRRVVEAINAVMQMPDDDVRFARILGVHFEGIFANRNMCGALRPEFFKVFTGIELNSLPRPSAGCSIMTFAPEIQGGIELAGELKRKGWIASIGHTSADCDTLEKAFLAGARHFTHFFNAMSGIHHRQLGVAGWALTNEEVTFDIIADGIHVDPRMLKLATRAKSPEKTILISDSVAPAGLGDGVFRLWGKEVRVASGRTISSPDGGIAGSVITMADAVRLMLEIGFNQTEVSAMASLGPARLISIESDCGSIAVGKRADLVVIGPNKEIDQVIFGGRPVM